MTTTAAASDARASLMRITLISALVLFLEMLLIRWVGTELRVFAYLQNAVLVATFIFTPEVWVSVAKGVASAIGK